MRSELGASFYRARAAPESMAVLAVQSSEMMS